MTQSAPDISRILLDCETKGYAPCYNYLDAPMFPADKFDSQGPLVRLSLMDATSM